MRELIWMAINNLSLWINLFYKEFIEKCKQISVNVNTILSPYYLQKYMTVSNTIYSVITSVNVGSLTDMY